MYIFNKWENKKENVEKNHIVDWDIYVTFVNHLDHLKKIFHFWFADSTEISQISRSLH